MNQFTADVDFSSGAPRREPVGDAGVLELLSGSHPILGELGHGGGGVVYEVGREGGSVAVKVLRAELALSERECARFLREAERMRRVCHPGLATVMEAGTLADGRPYLMMPRLRGETLAARLENRGPLLPGEAVRVFVSLARAVEALHSAGMVHRDIKPENVMLVEGEPVLLDFGIARELDDAERCTTTAEGRVRGTPAYMAPERFFGEAASVSSDVYELGVVLYLMLVGQLPWTSSTNVRERLHPRNPRESGIDVSPALAAAVLEALSTRPEVRPKSANAFAECIEAAMRGVRPRDDDRETAAMPSRERPPEVHATTHAAPRPRRSIFIALAACVAAGAMVTALASASARKSEPPPLAEHHALPAAENPVPMTKEPAPPPPPVASPSPASLATTVSPPKPRARPPRAERRNGDEIFFEDRQ